MGLFDRVRGLLGGDGRDGGGRDDDGRPGVRRREREGGHGDHWDALVDLEDEAGFQETIMAAVEGGTPVGGEPLDGREVTGLFSGPDPCQVCAVTVGPRLYTAYPALDGIEQELTVEEVIEWHTRVEAQVDGALGPASAAAFDTRYFARRDYDPGRTYAFSLAALAYTLVPADEGTVTGPAGEEWTVAGMAGFVPFERGDVDDVVLRTTAREVETLAFDGRTVYRLTVPLFRRGERVAGVDVALYASERALEGYVPEPGDDVGGVAWLQGRRA